MELTVEQYKHILRTAAGVADDDILGSDFLDVSWADLGFDSLAILEVTNQLERSMQVRMPEDEVDLTSTPRELLDHVNGEVLALAES